MLRLRSGGCGCRVVLSGGACEATRLPGRVTRDGLAPGARGGRWVRPEQLTLPDSSLSSWLSTQSLPTQTKTHTTIVPRGRITQHPSPRPTRSLRFHPHTLATQLLSSSKARPLAPRHPLTHIAQLLHLTSNGSRTDRPLGLDRDPHFGRPGRCEAEYRLPVSRPALARSLTSPARELHFFLAQLRG